MTSSHITRTATKHALLALSLLSPLITSAQKRIGDFIESTSYNDDKRSADRTLQYWPEDDAFVCVNGTNRYTRALYGGTSDFRLETSDRPVFATFKKNDCHNIAFVLELGGKTYPLDSVEYCRAAYDCGRRVYTLRDSRWGGKAQVDITALADYDTERALWRVLVSGFTSAPTIVTKVSDIAIPKLHRNGDMGVEPPGCFEAARGGKPTNVMYFVMGNDSPIVLSFLVEKAAIVAEDLGDKDFDKAEQQRARLASRLIFDTPEPWVNVLDGTLTAAADGNWDGETWLHGAVGWRMPLAGWRAGYLGDVLGWSDRAKSHFEAYAASQVTDVEPTMSHPTQDPSQNMARAVKKWGTQMYSNGYICRLPNKKDHMHHYDMNLNFIDELIWHLRYDASTEVLRQYWPTLKAHLEWEKRNFDPDDDGLYDAYCCIWASDALYYSGGAVTHSTAYNLMALKAAARIAELLGEDPLPFRREAEKTQRALDSRLWLENEGHWAEYQDKMGLGRIHPDAALWTIYTAIDCEAGSASQMRRATEYVDNHIPHIGVDWLGDRHGLGDKPLQTISTSDWTPYSWSINNVACAEVMNMALAYFEAGRPDKGYALLKANAVDNMLLGSSPGNFGQLSFYDAARGECYRDFGDVVGVAARAIVQGLFGVIPDALNGRCLVRPGFPADWDRASVRLPYLSYDFKRNGDICTLTIEQNFKQPLSISVEMLGADGVVVTNGSNAKKQTISFRCPRRKSEEVTKTIPAQYSTQETKAIASTELTPSKKYVTVDIANLFNDSIANIFSHEYSSPRPDVTTLQIPLQGIGEWCHPLLMASIDDSGLRGAVSQDGVAVLGGIPFSCAKKGHNVAYTSRWDNFPTEVAVPLKGKAACAYLLMAGSTNHMQTRIANADIIAEYADGSADTLSLVPPLNWCPIEQDYFLDGKAFRSPTRPIRVCLKDGYVGNDMEAHYSISGVYGREIPGGAGVILRMPLNASKKLKSLRLTALSNDVVIGLVGLTLGK